MNIGCFDRGACCGFAEDFPRRLGRGLLINLDSFLADKRLIALVVDHLVEDLPTPAGVMARDVLDNLFRNGLGGRVASHSNP